MTRTTITIKFQAGDDISEAFEEAIRIAQVLNIWVEFAFNGVTCITSYNGTVKKGVDEYTACLESKTGSKLAFA